MSQTIYTLVYSYRRTYCVTNGHITGVLYPGLCWIKFEKKIYLGGHLNRPRPLLTYHSRVGNSCTESYSFTLNKPHDLLFHNDSSSSIWKACIIPSVKNRGIAHIIYKFIYIWHCPSVSPSNNILTWEHVCTQTKNIISKPGKWRWLKNCSLFIPYEGIFTMVLFKSYT